MTGETAKSGRGCAVVFESDLDLWLQRVVPGGGSGERCAAVSLDYGDAIHYFLGNPRELPPHRGEILVGLAVFSHQGAASPSQDFERWRSVLPPGRPVGQLLQVSGSRQDGSLQLQSWSLRGHEWVQDKIMLVPPSERIFARNEGILESGLLAEREVAIVGLGSGGAPIAIELAKAGVGRFVLADQDCIEIENVGRHPCGVWDLGRRKTLALRDRILEKNPHARCRLLDGDVVEREGEFRALIADCHMLVGATDNNRSRRLINRLAIELRKPAIFGRAYQRACGGDVIRYRPGGPCYECLFGKGAIEEEVSSRRSRQIPAYADVPARVEPGLSVDIAPISLFCVRLVIQELVLGTGSSLRSLEDDLVGSLFLWANRREGQFSTWQPMGHSFKRMAVQRWYCLKAPRDPKCPACNEDAFLRGLEEELQSSLL